MSSLNAKIVSGLTASKDGAPRQIQELVNALSERMKCPTEACGAQRHEELRKIDAQVSAIERIAEFAPQSRLRVEWVAGTVATFTLVSILFVQVGAPAAVGRARDFAEWGVVIVQGILLSFALINPILRWCRSGSAGAANDDLRRLNRDLLVEKQGVYRAWLDTPDISRKILRDFQGRYSLGISRQPGAGDDLAFHLSVEDGDVRSFPTTVEVDGIQIPVIHEGGFHGAQALEGKTARRVSE
jgi:hypothetical protein